MTTRGGTGGGGGAVTGGRGRGGGAGGRSCGSEAGGRPDPIPVDGDDATDVDTAVEPRVGVGTLDVVGTGTVDAVAAAIVLVVATLVVRSASGTVLLGTNSIGAKSVTPSDTAPAITTTSHRPSTSDVTNTSVNPIARNTLP